MKHILPLLGAAALLAPTEAERRELSKEAPEPSGRHKKNTAQRRNKKKLVKKSRRGNRRK